MLACERRIRDSTPEIRAVCLFALRVHCYKSSIHTLCVSCASVQAGKLIPRGHGAKECLVVGGGKQPQTPELVKKFRSFTHPEAGQARVFRSPTGDPHIDEDICHGVKTKSSLEVFIWREIL